MQNKKLIVGAVVFLVSLGHTTAYANEIAGTRVQGQGAICGEGEGKSVEINATTKQEWSFCFKREVTIAPTPTPTPILASTLTTNTATQSNEPVLTQNTETATPSVIQTVTTDSATVGTHPTPTPTPTPTIPTAPPANLEKSNVVEVNASTNTAVIRQETDEEWLERWIRVWNDWYLELIKWWDNLWNWSSI